MKEETKEGTPGIMMAIDKTGDEDAGDDDAGDDDAEGSAEEEE